MTLAEAKAAYDQAIADNKPALDAALAAALAKYDASVVAARAVFAASTAELPVKAHNYAFTVFNAQDLYDAEVELASHAYMKAVRPHKYTYENELDILRERAKQQMSNLPTGGQAPPLHDPFGSPG